MCRRVQGGHGFQGGIYITETEEGAAVKRTDEGGENRTSMPSHLQSKRTGGSEVSGRCRKTPCSRLKTKEKIEGNNSTHLHSSHPNPTEPLNINPT